MIIELRPVDREPEFGEEALTGEWAAFLPEALAREQRPPWCNYSVRRDGELVGSGGFKSEPTAEGEVEIAYLTFLPMEGQGIATQTAAELVRLATENGATMALAHTLPTENGSTAVLRRNGFAFVGEILDPDDGPVWRWRRFLT